MRSFGEKNSLKIGKLRRQGGWKRISTIEETGEKLSLEERKLHSHAMTEEMFAEEIQLAMTTKWST
jgi:hypothetical protein